MSLAPQGTISLIKYTNLFQNKTILFFFFCRTAGLTGFESPDQGPSPSHGSESAESSPLHRQESPQTIPLLKDIKQKLMKLPKGGTNKSFQTELTQEIIFIPLTQSDNYSKL